MIFPVVTWQETVVGDLAVTVGGVTHTATLASQQAWGFGNTGVTAKSDTLAWVIAAALNAAHPDITGSLGTKYEMQATGPRIRWGLTASAAPTLESTGTTIAASTLGLPSLPQTMTVIGGPTSFGLSATRFSPGLWWPDCNDIRPEYNEVHRAMLDESPFDGSVYSAEYLGKVSERIATFDIVDAAYILTEWRAMAGIAARSGQAAADPYGFLGRLLEVALHGQPFRVYTDLTTYFDARLSNRRNPRTVLDLAVARADGRDRFVVTLPLVIL